GALASSAAAVMSDVLASLKTSGESGTSARSALPLLQALADVAVMPSFTRVQIWLNQAVDVMTDLAAAVDAAPDVEQPPPPPKASLTQSALDRLGLLLPTLSVERSVPPVNPLRLARSITASFASHADTVPRLIAALNPVAAPLVYDAW